MAVYTLLYIIIKNHCTAITCSNCVHYDGDHIKLMKGALFKCKAFKNYSAYDKIVSIIPSNGRKHSLWNVFLKHCNDHYIFGRSSCCIGCKFYVSSETRCIFNDIWNNIRLC